VQICAEVCKIGSSKLRECSAALWFADASEENQGKSRFLTPFKNRTGFGMTFF
jgi:hypothetical protein